jgi:hypothetical protein
LGEEYRSLSSSLCTRRVRKVKIEVLNVYNIFHLQKRHCEWISSTQLYF